MILIPPTTLSFPLSYCLLVEVKETIHREMSTKQKKCHYSATHQIKIYVNELEIKQVGRCQVQPFHKIG